MAEHTVNDDNVALAHTFLSQHTCKDFDFILQLAIRILCAFARDSRFPDNSHIISITIFHMSIDAVVGR
jgi:hypothetical protein